MARKDKENISYRLMTKYADYVKEIIKRIESLHRHTPYNVFSDFVEWGAYSLRQAVDFNNQEKITERIKSIEAKYTPDEAKALAETFGVLVQGMESEAQSGTYGDLIGDVFQELQANNRKTGQFFTPRNVATMMAKMLFSSEHSDEIEHDGHIVMMEPSAGSGIMILAFAEAMREKGFDPTSQLVIHAVDVDLRCVCMTYINTALYGFPAVIRYGDGLNPADVRDLWYTPIYVLELWIYRDKVFNPHKYKQKESDVLEAAEEDGPAEENAAAASVPKKAARTKRSDADSRLISLFDMEMEEEEGKAVDSGSNTVNG